MNPDMYPALLWYLVGGAVTLVGGIVWFLIKNHDEDPKHVDTEDWAGWILLAGIAWPIVWALGIFIMVVGGFRALCSFALKAVWSMQRMLATRYDRSAALERELATKRALEIVEAKLREAESKGYRG